MDTSSQCFVCHESHSLFENLHQAPITTSGSSVFALLEQILGYNLEPELTPLDFVCHTCVERFNDYDEAFRRAQCVASELLVLYGGKKMDREEMHFVVKAEALQQDDFQVALSIPTDNANKPEDNLRSYKTEDVQNEVAFDLLAVDSHQTVVGIKRKPGRPVQNNCKRCNIKFTSPSELTGHDCNPKEKPFICDICGQNYKSKSSLSIHMAVHTGVSLHNCEVCGKSFTQRGALTRHMPLHTGEKPYQVSLTNHNKLNFFKHILII